MARFSEARVVVQIVVLALVLMLACHGPARRRPLHLLPLLDGHADPHPFLPPAARRPRPARAARRRQRQRPRPRRRLHPAGQAIVVGVGALVLAALLNAPGLHKTAESLDPGWKRTIVLPLTEKLDTVSHYTGLDLPRRSLKAALGRSGDDDIVSAIVLPPPPPVAPHPAPPPPPPHHGTNPPPPPTPTPPPPPPKKPAFSPNHPLRVYVGGDSLIIVPGNSLLSAMGSRVYKAFPVDGHVATGLERPDVYNWFDRIKQVMKTDRPNVVVVAFGANDNHSYMTGLPPGVDIGQFGSSAWIKEYRRRVAGFMDTVIRGGGFIVWLGMPIVSSKSESEEFDLINRILYQEAKKRPNGALYVDTWFQFADPKTGGYAEYLPNRSGELVKVRAGDGVHFEPAGGDIIARLVLKSLNQRYDLTSWKKHQGG